MKRSLGLVVAVLAASPSVASADGPPADVELHAHDAAIVHGAAIPFDGLAEGLSWPALERALGRRAPGSVIVIRAARALPIVDVLRAAWTLRASRLRIETSRSDGTVSTATFDPRPATADPATAVPSASTGCHLSVFVGPGGDLRTAAPGGPSHMADAEALVRALRAARGACPLRYVSVGAEADTSAWGPVFDLAATLESSDALGTARVLLGQALR